MSTERLGLLVIVILVLVAAAEAILVLEGLLPPASKTIRLEAPLYPKRFVYEACFNVYLGRGTYVITIRPKAPLTLVILRPYDGGGPLVFGNVTCVKTVRLHSEGPIILRVYARLKPGQTDAGTLEVRRR